MKALKQTYLFIVGLIVMASGYIGHISNLDCSKDVSWPSTLYVIGALIFGLGLYKHFQKTIKSEVKATIFSLLLIMLLFIIGFVLAVSSQPDGIFHCFQF